MSIKDIPLTTLDGKATSLDEHTGKAVLVVNVASKCGLTPQYTALEKLHETYAGRGFSVVGFPSNQFGEQEPGTADEIQTFCSTTYGVTFPLFEKTDVNGEARHPVYQELVKAADTEGYAGDVELREVPARRRRQRGSSVQPTHRAGRTRGRLRDRSTAVSTTALSTAGRCPPGRNRPPRRAYECHPHRQSVRTRGVPVRGSLLSSCANRARLSSV